MWSEVSNRFLRALHHSHDVVSRVDVWRGGVLLESAIPVTGGSVTVDESSQVRRTLSLSVGDLGLDPRDANSLLAPFGTELAVHSGIRFPEGDTEMVPLGVFQVEDAGRSGWFSEVGLTGVDRSRTVAGARFLKPRATPQGRPIVQEISTFIREVNTSYEVLDLTSATSYTAAATWERERWEAVETLADAIAADVVADPQGRFLIRRTPGTGPLDAADAVWAVNAGPEGVLLDAQTGLTREGIYNAVVASSTADPDSPPITAVAYQRSGPFRWDGPFGKVPRFYSSPLLRTRQMCERAARSVLARSVGYGRRITPTAVPNPALDAGDVIEVTLPDGTVDYQVASRFSVPLGGDQPMPITSRAALDAVTGDIEVLG